MIVVDTNVVFEVMNSAPPHRRHIRARLISAAILTNDQVPHVPQDHHRHRPRPG